MSGALVMEAVAAGYREVIVRGVSFVASPGEVFAIVGVNGAGKSTILKSIVGNARVHAGRVLLDEENITGKRGDLLARQGVAYIPQLNDVFPGLTVRENLQMGGYLLPRKAVARRAAEVLARFPQLQPKRSAFAHKLSGGERKQLAIARALMWEPKVLLVDEPTSNLSPNVAEEVLGRLLRTIADDGRCVVVVEQRVEMVLEAADRACLIGGGRMRKVENAAAMLDTVREEGLLTGAGEGERPEADGRQSSSERRGRRSRGE